MRVPFILLSSLILFPSASAGILWESQGSWDLDSPSTISCISYPPAADWFFLATSDVVLLFDKNESVPRDMARIGDDSPASTAICPLGSSRDGRVAVRPVAGSLVVLEADGRVMGQRARHEVDLSENVSRVFVSDGGIGYVVQHQRVTALSVFSGDVLWTSDHGLVKSAAYSYDADRLLISTDSSNFGSRTIMLEGATGRPIWTAPQAQGAPSSTISPDGRWVAVQGLGTIDLYMYPLPMPIMQRHGYGSDPVFAHDSKALFTVEGTFQEPRLRVYTLASGVPESSGPEQEIKPTFVLASGSSEAVVGECCGTQKGTATDTTRDGNAQCCVAEIATASYIGPDGEVRDSHSLNDWQYSYAFSDSAGRALLATWGGMESIREGVHNQFPLPDPEQRERCRALRAWSTEERSKDAQMSVRAHDPDGHIVASWWTATEGSWRRQWAHGWNRIEGDVLRLDRSDMPPNATEVAIRAMDSDGAVVSWMCGLAVAEPDDERQAPSLGSGPVVIALAYLFACVRRSVAR